MEPGVPLVDETTASGQAAGHGHHHEPDECDCGHHHGRHGHHGHGYGRFPIWGLFVLFLGVGWLGGEMDWWRFSWALAGPVALILAGLGMVLGWARRRGR
jgi:hypothetical protein